MSLPKVSIGMPIFNAERYLAQAIESLVQQSMTDWELLISDNASSDRSREIAESFSRTDSRIRVVSHSENRGSAWNFNYVFNESQGEYFKWQAYDDLCHPTFLQRCCELLDQRPEVLWCHSWTVRIFAEDDCFPDFPESIQTKGNASAPWDQTDVNMLSSEPASRSNPNAAVRFRSIILGKGYDADAYGLFRRSALAKTRLELPFYGSEKVTLCELALQGQFAEIPEVLFAIREHDKASGALQTVQQQQEFVSPGKRASGLGTRIQLLRALATSLYRFPLKSRQRMACWISLIRYLMQVSKWKLIFKQVTQSQAIRTAERNTNQRVYGQKK